jgi:hypothetical protein
MSSLEFVPIWSSNEKTNPTYADKVMTDNMMLHLLQFVTREIKGLLFLSCSYSHQMLHQLTHRR